MRQDELTCPEHDMPIAQLRWNAAPIPRNDFLQGVRTITTTGDSGHRSGMAAHTYLISTSMVDQNLYSSTMPMASFWSCRMASCISSPSSA